MVCIFFKEKYGVFGFVAYFTFAGHAICHCFLLYKPALLVTTFIESRVVMMKGYDKKYNAVSNHVTL